MLIDFKLFFVLLFKDIPNLGVAKCNYLFKMCLKYVCERKSVFASFWTLDSAMLIFWFFVLYFIIIINLWFLVCLYFKTYVFIISLTRNTEYTQGRIFSTILLWLDLQVGFFKKTNLGQFKILKNNLKIGGFRLLFLILQLHYVFILSNDS